MTPLTIVTVVLSGLVGAGSAVLLVRAVLHHRAGHPEWATIALSTALVVVAFAGVGYSLLWPAATPLCISPLLVLLAVLVLRRFR